MQEVNTNENEYEFHIQVRWIKRIFLLADYQKRKIFFSASSGKTEFKIDNLKATM